MLNCKYFLYVRKSSESKDRQIQSIDDQISVLRELANERQLTIVDEFIEAKSAKSPGRPIFNEMIERLHKGEAQGIITWNLDRLSRNPIDSGTISWMVQEKIILHVQTSERSYYSEDNVLLMAVENGMANQYIRDLSSNTKRGLLKKAERGWYPAQATLGYINNPQMKKGEKEIIKDPNSFELTRMMFDMMLTGAYTPPQILNIATDDWGLKNRFGNQISKATIYRIFKDPFYYGRFEYPIGSGNYYEGAHEPMITFEEYKRIQKILGRGKDQKPVKHTFAYTGIIKCEECGAAITAEHKHKKHKNGNEHHYIYYHCTGRKDPNCTQRKNLEQDKLEQQIVTYLEKLIVPEELINWAITQIGRKDEDIVSKNKTIRDNQKRELTKIDVKLDNLFDLRLSEEITDELFSRKKTELLDSKERLTNSLKTIEDSNEDMTSKIKQLFDFSNALITNFNNADKLKKKEILSVVCSNLTLLDKKLNLTFKKPINYIAEIGCEFDKEYEVIEEVRTHSTPYTTRTSSDLVTASPVMLRG